MKIFTINNKKEKKFLREKTAKFDFSTHLTNSGQEFTKKQIQELIKNMREAMKTANGIGLSANQVGLDIKFFVAQIPGEKSTLRFYAIFNPEITKPSKEKNVMEEGCLSVPELYGWVERPEKITLIGQDKNGKKIKIKAWGLLARVFQHEVDHLNGVLFIDRTKKVYKLPTDKQQVL